MLPELKISCHNPVPRLPEAPPLLAPLAPLLPDLPGAFAANFRY